MMSGMILWGLLWTLVGIAVLVLAVLGMVHLVRRDRDAGRGGGSRSPPTTSCTGRYAAGEIDDDEYNRRRAHLS